MSRYEPHERNELPERIISSAEIARPRKLGLAAAASSAGGLAALAWTTPELLGNPQRSGWLLLMAAACLAVSGTASGIAGFLAARAIRRDSKAKLQLYGTTAMTVSAALLGLFGVYASAVLAVMVLFGTLIAAGVALGALALVVVLLTNVDY